MRDQLLITFAGLVALVVALLVAGWFISQQVVGALGPIAQVATR